MQRTEQTANGLATYSTPDFRMYAPVTAKNRQGQQVKMTLCEELVKGRWEAFYSIAR